MSRIFTNGALRRHISKYPAPKYLNYSWGFGSTLGIMLALQIFTGLILAFYYRPSADTAFGDVIAILFDVNYGYLVKYLHLNGASIIFLLMYLHLLRGVYYRSYIRSPQVWGLGMLIFLIMILTAFLGYVLPWGQMSFWAATVITNLITSLPVVGGKLITLVHGAFSVHDVTLTRFFVLHFLFAIIAGVLALVHVFLLHKDGSSNPSGLDFSSTEKVQFSYYYASKDWAMFAFFMFLLLWLVFTNPNYLNHPDNFIEANPLVTPSHIVPEWYFLPFYAILRAIPNKLLGVVAMGLSILLLALLPVLASKARPSRSGLSAAALDIFFYMLTFCLVTLGGLGAMPASGPYVPASQLFTALYFLSFLLPVLASMLGRWKKFNEVIAERLR